MIKVEVTSEFTYKDYEKLKNIKRKSIDVKGKLFVGDTFECDKEIYDYLNGGNKDGYIVVKILEVVPEMPTIIGHRADDVEYVAPLDNENMKKLSKAIEKRINENGLTVEGLGIKKEIKPKKKKTSKK